MIIVGLGNPGTRYSKTRHNAGFLVLDELVRRWQGQFKDNKDRYTASCIVETQRITCIKPLTFMNLSGRAVAPLVRFEKRKPQDILVIYDDLDTDSLRVRSRIGGGSGGHNGIKSLIQELGSAEFHRIKIGIGRPIDTRFEITDWVLGNFSDEELDKIQNEVTDAVLERIKSTLHQRSL